MHNNILDFDPVNLIVTRDLFCTVRRLFPKVKLHTYHEGRLLGNQDESKRSRQCYAMGRNPHCLAATDADASTQQCHVGAGKSRKPSRREAILWRISMPIVRTEHGRQGVHVEWVDVARRVSSLLDRTQRAS